jgi:hypothetical protein
MITGNVVGILVGLCTVAVWCFLHERFVPVGIVCLAIGLAVKPHDAGFIWLYFLLAGGLYRKRAVQTLLTAIALSLPGVLWVWHVAPHWMQELHANILALSVHGGISDPGVASTGGHGLDMLVSLQTVISVFWDDPRIYNMASYLVCLPLMLAWAFATLRSRVTAKKLWLALAAIAALSMLPVYHRQLDTKFLLLTVPACAMLWAEGGLIGWLALLVNAAAFVLTADLPWVILFAFINHLQLPATGLAAQISTAAQVFPAPFILLIMGVFYLWVYVSRSFSPDESPGSVIVAAAPAATAFSGSGGFLNRLHGFIRSSVRGISDGKGRGA